MEMSGRHFFRWIHSSMRPMGVVLFCASYMSAAALPTSAYADAGTVQTDELSAAALKQRGQQLRAEIDATYRRLRHSKQLARSMKDSNDISPVVLKYIPAGISFNQAEAILRAAGCRLSPSPTPTAGGYIFASGPVDGGLFDLMGHAFTVDLIPRTPGDFSVVGTVTASIVPLYS